eukprot:3625638-Rhodomonas_salina.1
MPERAQQIGAIVYRNVDSVKWEMMRIEVPEMIPRGAYNWRRLGGAQQQLAVRAESSRDAALEREKAAPAVEGRVESVE